MLLAISWITCNYKTSRDKFSLRIVAAKFIYQRHLVKGCFAADLIVRDPKYERSCITLFYLSRISNGVFHVICQFIPERVEDWDEAIDDRVLFFRD